MQTELAALHPEQARADAPLPGIPEFAPNRSSARGGPVAAARKSASPAARFSRLKALRWNRLIAQELFVYLAFGGTAAVVNLLAGWLLYGFDPIPWLPYWCATGLAATAGLVTNFCLNYLFNFRFRARSALGQFRTFCMVSGVGVLLTSAISTGLRAMLHHFAGDELRFAGIGVETDFAAHFLAVGLVVLYSYPAHKLISFNIGIRARLQQLTAAISR